MPVMVVMSINELRFKEVGLDSSVAKVHALRGGEPGFLPPERKWEKIKAEHGLIPALEKQKQVYLGLPGEPA